MAKITKNQNVFRQLSMHTLLINSMKEICYRHNDHYAMLLAILKFFESYYCYKCLTNQISPISASMGLRFSYSNFTNTEVKNMWEWGWNKIFQIYRWESYPKKFV